ncbi:ImmA/IrrE family metallo-endopeptidase [Cytophagaceae bacterium DM2B3-1]|uniref:ImmA/IrrE family metallo-endopeptidase n=1 Tax=Xanthocytophaga flava TaxID=3048013 RepID=A0ABT7CYU5_9BACT|nr:ImmA/IrrE family metallo-endopeptidase [Xanthocytophaga flavus]MDJ1498948.1 ImmA/IrrE family metallo-endopeptidase [Xanthocytophaga flavus]
MNNSIRPKIKYEIDKITTFLASNFVNDNQTALLAICEDEDLQLCLDDYGNYFDGMLVWDKPSFYIHLNTAKGNYQQSKRGRFTLAHELGHYFIDCHREGLKRKILNSHPSNNILIQHETIEAEADYFASCLLMPKNKLRSFTGGKSFSFDLLYELSNAFDVSLTAAILRFVEVGTHEIMVVFSENNQVKWYQRSADFPALPNKFRVGGNLPPTSVAGEFFRNKHSRYTGIEPISLDDWFYYRHGAPSYPLYEQCFYSDIYNYVISVIWFK